MEPEGGRLHAAGTIIYLSPSVFTHSLPMSIVFADAIFWVAVVCCIIAQLAILRSILATPASSATRSARALGTRRIVEAAWAVLPGVALAVVLCFTWAAIHSSPATSVP